MCNIWVENYDKAIRYDILWVVPERSALRISHNFNGGFYEI